MKAELSLCNFEESVAVLSNNARHGVVLDWWLRIEGALDYYFVAFHGRRRPRDFLQLLRSDGRVDSEVILIVDGLRRFRNRIAHRSKRTLSADDASRFARAAWLAAWAIGAIVPDNLARESGAAFLI
jgi:hypothetical protein